MPASEECQNLSRYYQHQIDNLISEVADLDAKNVELDRANSSLKVLVAACRETIDKMHEVMEGKDRKIAELMGKVRSLEQKITELRVLA
jgi:chromosome segregation ATPase